MAARTHAKKQIQKNPNQSEEVLRALVNATRETLLLIDTNGAILLVNETSAERLGKSVQELVGTCLYGYFPPELAKTRKEQFDKVFATGEPVRFEDTRAERYFEVCCYPVFNEEGKVSGGAIFAHDFTDRKQAEGALKESEERFKSLYQESPIPAFTWQKKGDDFILVDFNRAMIQVTNGKVGDYLGTSAIELYRNRPDILNGMDLCSKEQPVVKREIVSRNFAPGILFSLYYGFVPPDLIIVHTEDITERKRAEDERNKTLLWQQGVNLLQQSLLAPATLEEKLRAITDSIVSLFDADFCRIWLIKPGDLCEQGCVHAEVHEGPHICRYRDRCLHLLASSGRYTHTDGTIHRRVPFGCYKIGRVASDEDHKFLTNDAQNDPRIHNPEWARELGLVSFAGYQLRVPGGKTLGVLALFAKHPILPPEDTMLDGLSSTVALVVQRDTAEKSLQESEEKHRLLFDGAGDAIFVVDAEARMLAVNTLACERLGYTHEELMSMTVDQLDSPSEAPRAPDRMALLIEHGRLAFETMHKRKDGSLIPTDVIARRITWGGQPAIMSICRDITDRKQAGEALKESESRLATIFENDPSGIILVNTRTRTVHDVNRAAVEMIGLPKEDLVGKACHNFLCPAEEGRCPICDLGQEVDRSERVLICADGKRLPILKTVVPIKISGEEYLLENFIDITARKQAEEELKQAVEKLRKGLTGTIHAMSLMVETRDPYTAGHQKRVSNLARVIAQEMNLPKDMIDKIRMAGVIHDIGKISVPAEILSKPTKLTAIEFSLIKVHPQSGYDILKDVDLPYPIAEIVYQHHERLDGSGYPQGLKDGQILLEACILAVADVVEAMASHRPYRPAIGIERALEEIEKNKGIFYDIKAVDACVRLFRDKGFKFETTAS
jgi:PAS domain S-box-containing protein